MEKGGLRPLESPGVPQGPPGTKQGRIHGRISRVRVGRSGKPQKTTL